MQAIIHKLNAEPTAATALLKVQVRRYVARHRRFDLVLLLALVLTTPCAVSQTPDLPEAPNQYNANDLEVRRDALPDELPLDQIEVVVEASDAYCKPQPAKLFGISLPVRVAPVSAYFCENLATYLSGHAGALPVRLSRQLWSQRKVADQVAGLDVVPQRRYMLLSRWRSANADVSQYGYVSRVRWVVEEVLWDFAEGRLLWHSLRNIYSNEYDKGRVWGMQVQLRGHLAFTLPATLARRGELRSHTPVPGGRWVEAQQIEGWQSASRAAIAFVNSYSSTSRVRDFHRSKAFLVRAVDQAPYHAERLDWASDARMRADNTLKMAVKPAMDYGTHAMLELPPGRYVVDPYDSNRARPFEIELKAGEIAVVEFSRNLVGADGPELADIKTWTKALARGRHAFLEDVRVLQAPWQVDCWFVGP